MLCIKRLQRRVIHREVIKNIIAIFNFDVSLLSYWRFLVAFVFFFTDTDAIADQGKILECACPQFERRLTTKISDIHLSHPLNAVLFNDYNYTIFSYFAIQSN